MSAAAEILPASQRRKKPARRHGGTQWLLFAVLLCAVLAPVSGLWGVIEGRLWFDNATVTVAGTLAVGTLVRARGRSYALTFIASVAGLVAMLTLQFLPSTAVLGVIPTAESVRRAMDFYPQARDAVLVQAQPVLSEDPIIFFICLAAGVTALLAHLAVLGLRLPALSAVPLSVFLVIASLVKTNGAGLLPVSLTAVGFLLVLATSRLEHRATAPGAAVRTGVLRQGTLIAAGALALMLVVPLALPGFSQGLMPQGQRLYLFGKPSGVNPVLNLGVNLRDRLGVTTLTYYTDSPDPVYLRTSVISDLGAKRWEPTDIEVDRDHDTEDLDSWPDGFTPQHLPRTRTVHTRVVTGNYQSPWLPMPREASSVTGLARDWGYNGDTDTMFSAAAATSRKLDYTVTSQVPVIDADALEASSARLARDPDFGADQLADTYTQLQEDLPEIIPRTAQRIVRKADAGTAYDQAVALQEELRSVDYTYSEQTPLEQGYDGNGVGVVAAFLEKKSGYCTHYSSAMALMARTLGVPSRVVVGYAPGRSSGSQALGSDGKQWTGYDLSPRSAHAWPELFFPDLGWVPFEPTPGRGTTPSYASDSPTGGPADAQSPDTDPTRGRTIPDVNHSADPSTAPAAGGRESGNDDGASPTVPVLLALVVLLGLFGPFGIRRWQRARRLRRIHRATDWRDAVAGAWSELLALGRDYGLAQRPQETDAGYAARLQEHLPEAAGEVRRLREAFERASFSLDAQPHRQLVPRGPASGIHRPRAGRELPLDLALSRALTEIEQAFSDAASPGRQFLARAWPASLIGA
ncbi:transglutaminase TgpA family protein [Arthrobacter sp. 179]|uniref:transglutaminase TgpA family protein n=1 Tax=Arthrobacter sp. 179 TaxID=3457734 RepID=UPI004033A7C8